MDPTTKIILAGCLGALVPELIRIGKGTTHDVFKSPTYWIQLIAQVAVGALAAYYVDTKTPEAAFAAGYTLPQLITRIAAAPTPTPPVVPPVGGGDGPGRFSLRTWWSR